MRRGANSFLRNAVHQWSDHSRSQCVCASGPRPTTSPSASAAKAMPARCGASARDGSRSSGRCGRNTPPTTRPAMPGTRSATARGCGSSSSCHPNQSFHAEKIFKKKLSVTENISVRDLFPHKSRRSRPTGRSPRAGMPVAHWGCARHMRRVQAPHSIPALTRPAGRTPAGMSLRSSPCHPASIQHSLAPLGTRRRSATKCNPPNTQSAFHSRVSAFIYCPPPAREAAPLQDEKSLPRGVAREAASSIGTEGRSARRLLGRHQQAHEDPRLAFGQGVLDRRAVVHHAPGRRGPHRQVGRGLHGVGA